MSTLVCLGAGIEGLPILERAKALGHQLVVVDGSAAAPGFALADWGELASCYDPACFDKFDADLSGIKPDGVLCCAIDAPHIAATVAQQFGLPGLTPEQAHLSVDKLAQKTALRAAGLPVPKFDTLVDGLPFGRLMLRCPTVVKPVDSRGARGVQLVRQSEEIITALAVARASTPNKRIYAEAYLGGPQLSTESIIQDGRVLFTAIGLRNYDRLEQFAPFVIEDGYDMPWGDMQLRTNVDDLLARACAALDWYQSSGGTVKGDWIIHDGKLVILELAARLSGGFFGTHGIPLASGVDFVGTAIRLALGERVEAPQVYADKWVAQRYVFPEPGDIGRRVRLVPDTLVSANFATYAIHPGDTIRAVVSHGQRWGQATCTGTTAEEARERAERAGQAMKQAVILE